MLSLLTASMLTFTSCDVLEQMHEYERFIQCDFNLVNIQVLEIGGIDISSVGGKSDLGIIDMVAITNKIFSGEFPARISVNLKAKNNDIKKASIAGMDWRILMKEEEMLSGLVDRVVVVDPKASTDFPVIMEVDLIKLLKSESLPQIMAFAFGDNQYEELDKLGVEIKIRPYYQTNSGIKKYPGYLTIKP